MRLVVPTEMRVGEKRVALVPELVSKFTALGLPTLTPVPPLSTIPVALLNNLTLAL